MPRHMVTEGDSSEDPCKELPTPHSLRPRGPAPTAGLWLSPSCVRCLGAETNPSGSAATGPWPSPPSSPRLSAWRCSPLCGKQVLRGNSYSLNLEGENPHRLGRSILRLPCGPPLKRERWEGAVRGRCVGTALRLRDSDGRGVLTWAGAHLGPQPGAPPRPVWTAPQGPSATGSSVLPCSGWVAGPAPATPKPTRESNLDPSPDSRGSARSGGWSPPPRLSVPRFPHTEGSWPLFLAR